jgi:type III pantothenate kinase
MILCLDVGNSHIFGGVFSKDDIQLRFRYNTKETMTSDQLGLFLRNVLKENSIDPSKINAISISSVVPSIDYSLRSACIKYFKQEPFFLQPSVQTGLNLQLDNPSELGGDRIANAIAAVHFFPNQNLVLIDLGTATTFSPISAQKAFLGGAIMPGMKLSMNALQAGTAKLFPVEILKPSRIVGKNTAENIQSGLYFGQLSAIKEISKNMIQEVFQGGEATVIGTGGFSYLFQEEHCFDYIVPDLVLHGLKLALDKSK